MLVATRLAAGFRDEVIISPDPRICMQRGSQCSAHIVFLTSKRPMIPITTSKTLHVALMVFASMVRPPKRWCCPGGEASPLDIVSRADGAEAGHRRRQDERKQAIEEAEKFANPSKKLVARVLSGITTCLWHNSPCECGTLCATYCCSILPGSSTATKPFARAAKIARKSPETTAKTRRKPQILWHAVDLGLRLRFPRSRFISVPHTVNNRFSSS